MTRENSGFKLNVYERSSYDAQAIIPLCDQLKQNMHQNKYIIGQPGDNGNNKQEKLCPILSKHTNQVVLQITEKAHGGWKRGEGVEATFLT